MKKIILILMFLVMMYTVSAVDTVVSINKTVYTNGCISIGGACGNQLDSGNHLNLADGFFVPTYAVNDFHAWYPPANPVSWAYIDLDGIYAVTRVDISEAQYGSNPSTKDREIVYGLDYSEDNVTWQTEFTGHDLRDASMTNDSNIVNFNAQYIRINITAYESSFGRVDEITVVGELIGDPLNTPDYYVVLNKSIEDINISNIKPFNFTATVTSNNMTRWNTSNNSQSYMELSYKLVTGLNDCVLYYQTECIQLNNTNRIINMTKILNDSFYTTLYDTEYFPAYYPFDYSFIRNTEGGNHSIYNNNYIKFNIYNFSVNAEQFVLTVEFDGENSTTGFQPLNIWYCNSSYVDGNPAILNTCELMDSFNPEDHPRHEHNPFGRHYSIPYIIQDVEKTQTSYILFLSQSTPVNQWVFRYVENITYDNSSFNIGNYNSWNPSARVFDIHIHPFLENDKIEAYSTYYDNATYSNVSNTLTDYYNFTPFPPSATIFTYPDCDNSSTYEYTVATTQNTSLYFEWLASVDANNDSILYNVYFDSTQTGTNISILNMSMSTNANIFSGEYTLTIQSCDAVSCDSSFSSCNLYLCENSYSQNVAPCTDSVRLITFSDDNSCSEIYNIPASNGTYESCEIPATQVVISVQTELLMMLIIICFLILSMMIALRSTGISRSIIAFTGVTVIALGILIRSMLIDGSPMNYQIYMVGNIFVSVMSLIGLGLIGIGIFNMIAVNKDKKEKK